MKPDSKSGPCGNEDCDKCDPRPRWKISRHRLQHLTYTREIKAATAEEAMQIFEEGTAWPSQYDDNYGAVVQLDVPVTEKLPPDEYHLTECCYHNLSTDSIPVSGPDTSGDEKVPALGTESAFPVSSPAQKAKVIDPHPQGVRSGPVVSLPDKIQPRVVSLLDEIQGPIGAGHLPRTIDRLEMALERMLEAMPEFEGGGPLVDQLGEEMAFLRAAAREACRLAGVTWASTFEQERLKRWIRGPARVST
jgi:hypothetical protein